MTQINCGRGPHRYFRLSLNNHHSGPTPTLCRDTLLRTTRTSITCFRQFADNSCLLVHKDNSLVVSNQPQIGLVNSAAAREHSPPGIVAQSQSLEFFFPPSMGLFGVVSKSRPMRCAKLQITPASASTTPRINSHVTTSSFCRRMPRNRSPSPWPPVPFPGCDTEIPAWHTTCYHEKQHWF